MSDFYTEQMIKRQSGPKEMLIRIAMLVLCVASVLLIFTIPFGIIIPVLAIVATYFVFQRLNVEYEYLFVNGDLDIDKIMNKSKRKQVLSININDVELLAPVNSAEVRQYQSAKSSDYTSGTNPSAVFALVVKDRDQMRKIFFEPNEEIVNGFFMLAPRKVVKSS